jgi:hypothetical protein
MYTYARVLKRNIEDLIILPRFVLLYVMLVSTSFVTHRTLLDTVTYGTVR